MRKLSRFGADLLRAASVAVSVPPYRAAFAAAGAGLALIAHVLIRVVA
jgi:hypothetical protein